MAFLLNTVLNIDNLNIKSEIRCLKLTVQLQIESWREIIEGMRISPQLFNPNRSSWTGYFSPVGFAYS